MPAAEHAIDYDRRRIIYTPSWGQAHFHRMRGRAKVRASFGGIGSGKTCGGAHEAMEHAWGETRGGTGLIVVPSYRSFDEVTMKEIRRWWPQGLWKLSKESGGRHLTCYWGDGKTGGTTEVLVRSAKNAGVAEEIRGPDINWVWGDEPGTWGAGIAAWNLIVGRVREIAPHAPWAMPNIFLTGSPRWGWLNKVFGIKGRMPPHAWTSGYFSKGKAPEEAFYVRAMRSRENPANDPGYDAWLRSQYGDAFYQQEAEGDFMPPTGAVFPHFYRDIHVIPHELAMRMYAACRVRPGGIDWGFANPAAMIATGINGDGGQVVVREWSKPGHTSAQMAAIGRRWESELGITRWYADPESPEGIDTWKGKTRGVTGVRQPVRKADNARKDGFDSLKTTMRLESRLMHPAYPGAAVGTRPATWCYISEECTGLIEDVEGLRFKDVLPGRDWNETAMTGLDHRVDAWRYAVHSSLKRQGWTGVSAEDLE